MTGPQPTPRYWAALLAGCSLAALGGAAAMGAVAPRAVADFFTLYRGHGHGALFPSPDIFHSSARMGLLLGGVALAILAGVVFASGRPRIESLAPRGGRRAIIVHAVAALLAFHVIWYAGQMAVSYTAFQRQYAHKFAGLSMREKLRLCIGDYPDRWGAIAAETPSDARLLRHTRGDVTFLPAFVSPRLVFIYEGEEFSPVPPDELREDWLREKDITHILLSEPWEPGGPFVLKSIEEFLRERRARTDSAQRLD